MWGLFMTHRIASYTVLSFALFAAAGCKSGSSAPQRRVEQPVPVATPAAAAQAAATPFPRLPAPAAADVRDAVHRVFGDVLWFKTEPGNFIVGDFNGDGAEDLAVIGRPAAGKLAEINSEFANWIVQDADHVQIAAPNQRVMKFAKEKLPEVSAGEVVLAVIHGFGARGWRNPEARQAYLVKHAAGTFEGTAPSISQKSIRAMHLPVETEIINSVRNNRKGFVFWTGGVYAWHPREG
jgi:hypothetical protein